MLFVFHSYSNDMAVTEGNSEPRPTKDLKIDPVNKTQMFTMFNSDSLKL